MIYVLTSATIIAFLMALTAHSFLGAAALLAIGISLRMLRRANMI